MNQLVWSAVIAVVSLGLAWVAWFVTDSSMPALLFVGTAIVAAVLSLRE